MPLNQTLFTKIIDIFFVSTAMSFVYFYNRIEFLLAVLTFLPLMFINVSDLKQSLRRVDPTVIFICSIFMISGFWVYFNHEAFDFRGVIDSGSFYINILIVSLLGAWRVQSITDLSFIFRYVVSILLVFTFILLIFPILYISPFVMSCRIGDIMGLPFTPAMFFCAYSLMSFIGWRHLHRYEKVLRYGFLAMAVVVALAITGSRGIFIAFLMCIFLLTLFLIAFTSKDRPSPFYMVCSVSIGVACSFLYASISGCSLIRFETLLSSFQYRDVSRMSLFFVLMALFIISFISLWKLIQRNVGERLALKYFRDMILLLIIGGFLIIIISAFIGGRFINIDAFSQTDGGIIYRLRMTLAGLQYLMGHEWVGRGFEAPNLTTQKYVGDFPHMHSTYVSWYLSGGVLHLAAGFIFVYGAHFWRNKNYGFDWLIGLCATSFLFGLASLTDNFLYSTPYVTQYIILTYMVLKLQAESLAVVYNEHRDNLNCG